VIANLGEKDDSAVVVKNGRFGAYLTWNKVNVKLPSQYIEAPAEMPLDEAWALIQEKAGAAKQGNKKKKANKRLKDPELPPAPKRPLSAWLHFCAEKRPEVAATTNSLGEASKALATLWASTADRERYEKMALACKNDYEAKKADWEKQCQAILQEEDAKGPSRRKRTVKPNGGIRRQGSSSSGTKKKRPPSAYILFCMDYRPKASVDGNGNKLSFGETAKRLASLWKDCDDEIRVKFENLAAQEKEKLLK